MMTTLNEIDSLEILTLQDNYVDLLAGDSNDLLQRAMPFRPSTVHAGQLELSSSLLAEHGFAALVTATTDGVSRSLLLDSGFSQQGAAHNADALGVDLTSVEVVALSHGHLDHTGGLQQLVERVGKPDLELVLHPAAFRSPRYMKLPTGARAYLPTFSREKAQAAGTKVTETREAYPLLGGDLLFLGEIPRRTTFEKGTPIAFYEADGEETWDPIEDDTGIVAHVRGKGSVVLSGCAHSGIVNTLAYARETAGTEQVFAVMGGFHLTGPAFEPIITATTDALRDMDPTFIVPTHCTGRRAILHMEQEMPEKFLLNMVGTTLRFVA